MEQLTIHSHKIRDNMIRLEIYDKPYFIYTDSIYRSAKKIIKDNTEFYIVKCHNGEKDEYYYENDSWKSYMFDNFSGEIPTLNDCRHAILYLEITRYFTILNIFLPQLDNDIVSYIKSIICFNTNLKSLMIKMNFNSSK